MSTTTHAQGPWSAHPNWNGSAFEVRSYGAGVAWVHADSEEELVANAQLVAAAPDLLRALRDINARLCARGGPTPHELAECRALAQRAIAKAEGRS